MYALEDEFHNKMSVMDNDSEKLLNYRQILRHHSYKNKWGISSANEFGRLENGVDGRIKNPTNTIIFLHKTDVPKKQIKYVTYSQFVWTVQPEKSEKNRTRFMVSGDRINYPGEVGTPTADMMVEKYCSIALYPQEGQDLWR